jgi:hypothetical protein
MLWVKRTKCMNSAKLHVKVTKQKYKSVPCATLKVVPLKQRRMT